METKQRKRLLFVCLGNICRSPAAEAIMKSLVREVKLSDKYEIDSAGIGGWHVGELPDKRMREHAQKRGYQLTSRARQFVDNDFHYYDYIVVMDNDNYKHLTTRINDDNLRSKVLKMKDFFQDYKNELSVPDPYYGTDKDFEWAIDLIEDGCRGLLNSNL